MRAVVQRVKRARVVVEGAVTGEISRGLVAYIGVEKGDTDSDAGFIASKITGLRVFEDGSGKFNLDVREAGGEVLCVSQFTLLGDCRKGRRPSFDGAEAPEAARKTYESLVESIRGAGLNVETGVFQAHMEVESVNDGPVTLLLDSRKAF